MAGRPEEFSCAPGPAGWRYASAVLDLTCDARFRCARVQVVADSGAWVRGGRSVTDDGTPVLSWRTSSDPERERHAVADVVDAPSPGALVALARRVALPSPEPAEAQLGAVRFALPSLGGLSVRLRVARVGADVHEGLLAERWHVDDVDSGERCVVHLAGDVVLYAVRGEWEVELAFLDSPPSRLS